MRWWGGIAGVVLYAQVAFGACSPCASNPSPPAPLSGGLGLELVDRCQCDAQTQINNNAVKLNTAITTTAANTFNSSGTQTFNDPVDVKPDGTNGVGVNASGLLAKAGTGSVRADDVVCTSCIALTSEVTGLLPVANGGHGAAPTAADQVFVSTSTSAGSWIGLPSGGTNGCSGTNDKPLYNSATDTWSCGTDQTGSGSAFDPSTTIGPYEEFIGGNNNSASTIAAIGELGWSLTNTGGSCAAPSQDAQVPGRWGLLKITTASATDDSCMLILGTTGAIPSISGFDTSSNWSLKVGWALTSGASIKVLIGFGAAYTIASTPTHFIGIRYDTSSADANYVCMSCLSGTCTTTATSVAGNNANYHSVKLQRVSCAQGACLRCTVDGNQVDVAANMTSASLRPLLGVATRTSSTKSITFDYWRYLDTGASR